MPVKFDEGYPKPPDEYGKSSAYYVYDTESDTVHALFQLTQDSARKEPPNEYSNVAKDFQFELDFLKDRAELVNNLGDKAYYSEYQSVRRAV